MPLARRKLGALVNPDMRRVGIVGPGTRATPPLACVVSLAALLAFAAPASAQVVQPAGIRAKAPAPRTGTDSSASAPGAINHGPTERALVSTPAPVKMPSRVTEGPSVRDAVGIARARKAAARPKAAPSPWVKPPAR